MEVKQKCVLLREKKKFAFSHVDHSGNIPCNMQQKSSVLQEKVNIMCIYEPLVYTCFS